MTFTVPYSLELASETTYYVSVLIYGTTNEYGLGVTTSDDEDSGASTGWAIGNKGRHYQNSVWTETESTLKMSVRALLKVVIAPNETPVFTSPNPTLTVDENTAAAEDVGTAVAATDADAADTVTHTLEGTDGESFDIVSASGQIQTKAALNYEMKTSYSVTVRASDGKDDATTPVTINCQRSDRATLCA